MTVWTIAAQEGTGGNQVAAQVAASAGVPLLDRQTLARFAHELNPDDLAVDDIAEMEERVGGRLSMLALSLAMASAASAAVALPEVDFRHKLPELGRAVFKRAASQPCVIVSPAAFAALSEHPGAVHARLRAPLSVRVAAYQRDHLVDRRHAEKAVSHDDQIKSALVRSLYHLDINDDRLFALVLDAGRFTRERLSQILLAAGGIHATL